MQHANPAARHPVAKRIPLSLCIHLHEAPAEFSRDTYNPFTFNRRKP
jgi:hypothetical protein